MVNFLNSLGLILDIFGAALLWYFGLPPKVSREGARHLIIGKDSKEARKARKYDSLGNVGFGLLIIGFIFQFIGNYL